MAGLSENIVWNTNRTVTKGNKKMLHGIHKGKMGKEQMVAMMIAKAKQKKRARGSKGKGGLMTALMTQ